jgi:hypothetical protein
MNDAEHNTKVTQALIMLMFGRSYVPDPDSQDRLVVAGGKGGIPAWAGTDNMIYPSCTQPGLFQRYLDVPRDTFLSKYYDLVGRKPGKKREAHMGDDA